MFDCPDELQNMIQYVKDNLDEQETPAQFQERCCQIALAKHWEKIEREIEEDAKSSGKSVEEFLAEK
jgi:hypothetical protein